MKKGPWPNICCSSPPFGLVCSLFAFQWPAVSVRTMARVSLTSCPLIRRQQMRKGPRPCGIRAGWRMEQMQPGCLFTHIYTHSSAGINLLTPPAAPPASLLTSAEVSFVSVLWFLPLNRTISLLKCQEGASRSNCYSLLYYLNGTCWLNSTSHHGPPQAAVLRCLLNPQAS